MTTTVSIIIAIAIIAAVIIWLFRAERKESHHLDSLHITPDKKD